MAKGTLRALVPVTGHPVDEETVALACDLVRPEHGVVWVLYVIEVTRALPLDAEIPAETAAGEDVLQRMERIGKARKCRIEGEILQARNPGPAIVQEALERDVQVIVVGLPYMERYGTPTLGEVVPYILKHSHCRVLVNREQSERKPVGTEQTA